MFAAKNPERVGGIKPSPPVLAAVLFSTLTGGANGTAVAGVDFTAIADQLVQFAAGETVKMVTVSILGNTTPEAAKTFSVVLSSPTGGASIQTGTGTGTTTGWWKRAPPPWCQKPCTCWSSGAASAVGAAAKPSRAMAPSTLQSRLNRMVTTSLPGRVR